MHRKPRVLFIHHLDSTFVEKDFHSLKKYFWVKRIKFDPHIDPQKQKLKALWAEWRLFFGTLWADITFSWFAHKHAYFAVHYSKKLGKKSIVIIGGFDVAKVKKIGYGTLLKPHLAAKAKYIFENADLILAVDKGLKRDAIKNIGVKKNNILIVPTGYDYQKFKPSKKKQNLVITVASGNTWARVKLKGLDTFVKTARFLPQLKFILIGLSDKVLKKLKKIAPKNVKFINFISQEELIQYLQRAKVYCQLSLREGLPNTLCEAMLCECVPVGSKVQGITSAIGNTGFYVPYGDAKRTAQAIQKALRSNKGKMARERIKQLFPLERRERELKQLIYQLANKT